MVDIQPKKLTPIHVVRATSGEVIAGVAGARLRIYRASLSVTADSTDGLTTINDGVTTYWGAYNLKTSVEYGFDENGLAYIELPTGLGLDITIATAQNTAFNGLYEVVTPT